jgi:hypothetical protein
MKQESVAAALYYGLKKYGYEKDMLAVPFSSLPHDLATKLDEWAATIPQLDPLQYLKEFEAWADSVRHPDALNHIDSFMKLKGFREIDDE